MELSSPKIKKISYIFLKKVFLIFWEMELSGPNIKKLSYIFSKKVCLIFISGNASF